MAEKLNSVGKNGYGILFNRKSGNVVNVLEGNIPMLNAHAVFNGVSATRDFMVVGTDGLIYSYWEGQKGGRMPKKCEDVVGRNAIDFGLDVNEL